MVVRAARYEHLVCWVDFRRRGEAKRCSLAPMPAVCQAVFSYEVGAQVLEWGGAEAACLAVAVSFEGPLLLRTQPVRDNRLGWTLISLAYIRGLHRPNVAKQKYSSVKLRGNVIIQATSLAQ
jgi:hypothetical protein